MMMKSYDSDIVNSNIVHYMLVFVRKTAKDSIDFFETVSSG